MPYYFIIDNKVINFEVSRLNQWSTKITDYENSKIVNTNKVINPFEHRKLSNKNIQIIRKYSRFNRLY